MGFQKKKASQRTKMSHLSQGLRHPMYQMDLLVPPLRNEQEGSILVCVNMTLASSSQRSHGGACTA